MRNPKTAKHPLNYFLTQIITVATQNVFNFPNDLQMRPH